MRKKYYGHGNRGGVYKIANIIDGKVYIGSAKTFNTRASNHVCALRKQKHPNKHLQASFDKYGEEAFVFEVVEVVSGGKLDRTAREQYYLDKELKKNNWQMTYNFLKKATSKEGSCFSFTPEETRKKLSKAHKRVWSNPEHRKKMSKIRKAVWGQPGYKETRPVPSFRGPHSEQAKRRLSKLAKERFKDPEYRKNALRTAFKPGHKPATTGKKLPEETKRKISMALKGKRVVIRPFIVENDIIAYKFSYQAQAAEFKTGMETLQAEGRKIADEIQRVVMEKLQQPGGAH